MEVVSYGFFAGFIGLGFGALLGISCRAIVSTVNIFNKVIK